MPTLIDLESPPPLPVSHFVTPKEKPEYLKKNIYGQYYIINDPKDLHMKGILLKRLTM